MATKTFHHTPLALTYAESLLELAWSRNQAVDIGHELEALAGLLRDQPVFKDYLADPGIGQAERSGALGRIFRGRVSELVFNFLGVLNEHGRLGIIEQINSAYQDLLETRLGNVEIDVTSAQKLGADDLENVRQRVGQALGKNAVVHEHVDESIIGGLLIQVGDRIIDASVKQQLASLKQQLLTTAHNVRRG